MTPEDKEVPWGTFFYKVMPFGLKIATYQRAISALFHGMMEREMVAYVDEMIAKSVKKRIIWTIWERNSNVWKSVISHLILANVSLTQLQANIWYL